MTPFPTTRVADVPRHRPEDYKILRVYHEITGSTDERYWQNLQRRAAAQAQPLDVVFEQYEKPGEWTLLQQTDADMQRRVNVRLRAEGT